MIKKIKEKVFKKHWTPEAIKNKWIDPGDIEIIETTIEETAKQIFEEIEKLHSFDYGGAWHIPIVEIRELKKKWIK